MRSKVYRVLWLLLLVAAVHTAYADDPPRAQQSPTRFAPNRPGTRDSLDTVLINRNEWLYDSIRAKASRRKSTRALYHTLFRRPRRDSLLQGQIMDARKALDPYVGREIASISIERRHPFDVDGNWWERTANKLHTLTREGIIHRDLLFGVGDRFDADLMMRNLQLLQSRRYIADADLVVRPDSVDSMRLHLVILTRDSWTIDVDASVHSGGKSSLGLSESNFLGRGHEIRLETNLNYRNFDYGGNLLEYRIPNVLSSFYEFAFAAGKNFDRSRFNLLLKKDFLKLTDYEFGIEYLRNKDEHRFPDRDTVELVNSRRFDLWGGYSHYLPRLATSLYLSGRYRYDSFLMRPEDTAPEQHPALHDGHLLLANVGLYRERFYATSMIYGYGKREYLSSGFRSELTAGYRWGEYDDALYLGLSHTMGGFLSIGYLMGRAELGGHLLGNDRWSRAALDVELRWFSNLLRSRRTRIRQFAGLCYTQGWNRQSGADEWLEFTKQCGPRVLNEQLLGTNRLVLNAETVYFTPYAPLGFKLAIYNFLDAGLLGYDNNIFRNDPWCAVGVGVRLRNERLVFRTIQIQLGIAFGRHGWADSRWFRLSSEQDLQQFRYTPQRPDLLLYK